LGGFLEFRRNEFAMLDYDGDGAVTMTDVDLHRLALAADRRAGSIMQLLSADLNGDGALTRDGVREFVGGGSLQLMSLGQTSENEARLGQQIEAEVDKRMRADLNGDGRIDGAEILAFAKAELARAPVNLNPMILAALALDQDGDGRTVLAEFLTAVERVFR